MGPAGEPGPPAITAVYTSELPFDGDVMLSPQGFITTVLSLGIPAGAYVVTATMALENREDYAVDVSVWPNSTPPPLSFAGPRAGQIHLEAGGIGSVSVGPFVAEIGLAGVVAQLLAMRDAGAPGTGGVWATEGTRVGNRAGGTGLTALGTGPAVS